MGLILLLQYDSVANFDEILDDEFEDNYLWGEQVSDGCVEESSM